ncbi:MAG TPA: CHRD domain-containing protein [Gaiellaceae bacterium]
MGSAHSSAAEAASPIAPGQLGELIDATRAGATYANVHTTPSYPEGEIRGQIGHGHGHPARAQQPLDRRQYL